MYIKSTRFLHKKYAFLTAVRGDDDGGRGRVTPRATDRRVHVTCFDAMTRSSRGHRVALPWRSTGTMGRTGDGRATAATTVARTWERRSGRIGGFHVAMSTRCQLDEAIASARHDGRRGRGGGRATDGRRTGGDDGGEDVGAPQWEDRRVPCGDALARASRRLYTAMTVDGDEGADGRRTGDGRADGVVVRERRIGVGGSGGLRALTVGTAGLRCVKCPKIFGDTEVPAQNTFRNSFSPRIKDNTCYQNLRNYCCKVAT